MISTADQIYNNKNSFLNFHTKMQGKLLKKKRKSDNNKQYQLKIKSRTNNDDDDKQNKTKRHNHINTLKATGI